MVITEDAIHRYYWSVALSHPITYPYVQLQQPGASTSASATTTTTHQPVVVTSPNGPHQYRPNTVLESTPLSKSKGKRKAKDVRLYHAQTTTGAVDPSSSSSSEPNVALVADTSVEKVRKSKKEKKPREKKDERGAAAEADRAERKRRKKEDKRKRDQRPGEGIPSTTPADEATDEGAKKSKKRRKKDEPEGKPSKKSKRSKTTEFQLEAVIPIDEEEMDLEEIDELLPSSPVRLEDHDGFTFSPPSSSTPTALMTPHHKTKSKSKSKSSKSKPKLIPESAKPIEPIEQESNTKSKKRKSDSSTFDHAPHDSFSITDPNPHPNPNLAHRLSINNPNPAPKSMLMAMSNSRPVGTKVVDKPGSYRLKAIPGHLRAEMGSSPIAQSSTLGDVASGTSGNEMEKEVDGSKKPGGGSRWPTWATSTPDFLKKKK